MDENKKGFLPKKDFTCINMQDRGKAVHHAWLEPCFKLDCILRQNTFYCLPIICAIEIMKTEFILHFTVKLKKVVWV